MVEIIHADGSDIVTVNGPIDTDEITVSTVNGSTVITIMPPGGTSYTQVGDYTAKIRNYARRLDADDITNSTNVQNYLDSIGTQTTFIINAFEPACDRNEDGYFELSTTECIKLPALTWTYAARGGSELVEHNGDQTTTIKINFDSEIVYIDQNGQSELTKQKVVDMLEMAELNTEGKVLSSIAIDLDQISISSESGKTIITIQPPENRFYTIDGAVALYGIAVKNYAKKEDAEKNTKQHKFTQLLNYHS